MQLVKNDWLFALILRYMNIFKVTRYIVALIMPVVAFDMTAEEPVCYEASLTAGIGSGTFSPYYLSALRHGRSPHAVPNE